MGKESSFSNFQNRKGLIPADAMQLYHNASEVAKQTGNVVENGAKFLFGWLPFVDATKKKITYDPKVASRGSTQIKFPGNDESLKAVYDSEGITKNSLEGGDYTTQGKATILKLLDLYSQYRDDIDAGIFRDVHTRAPGITDDQDDVMREKLYSQYTQEKANNGLANGLYTMPGTSQDEYWQRTPLKMETILGQLWNGVSGNHIFNMTETGRYTTGLNRMLDSLSTEKPKYFQGGVLTSTPKFAVGGPIPKLQEAGTIGYEYWYPSKNKQWYQLRDITENVKKFQDGIYENAARYQNQFGIDNETYKRIGKLAVALMGKENSFSNFQNSKIFFTADMADTAHVAEEAGRQAINWITGKKTGWSPKRASRGSTQIKFPGQGEVLRSVYDAEGITENSLEGGDYKSQGRATILKLINLYNRYKNDINAGIFRDVNTRDSSITDDDDAITRKKLYDQYVSERKDNTLASGLYTAHQTSQDEYWRRAPLKMETILGQLWNGVAGDGIFNMSETGKYTKRLNEYLDDLTTTRPSHSLGGRLILFLIKC